MTLMQAKWVVCCNGISYIVIVIFLYIRVLKLLKNLGILIFNRLIINICVHRIANWILMLNMKPVKLNTVMNQST